VAGVIVALPVARGRFGEYAAAREVRPHPKALAFLAGSA